MGSEAPGDERYDISTKALRIRPVALVRWGQGAHFQSPGAGEPAKPLASPQCQVESLQPMLLNALKPFTDVDCGHTQSY
jgi:hypothetical protein